VAVGEIHPITQPLVVRALVVVVLDGFGAPLRTWVMVGTAVVIYRATHHRPWDLEVVV